MRRIKIGRPLAIFDIETTGTSVEIDRIIEIGVLKVKPDGSRSVFHTLVNPLTRIPIEATRVHNIKDADVRRKPTFRRIARRLTRFLKGCDLAGFNICRFDLPLLKKEFERSGVSFKTKGRHIVDVQSIFHAKERRDLSAAVKFYCGTPHEKAHSALDDARATWNVLKAQVQRYGDLPRTIDGIATFGSQESRYLDLGHWFELRHGEPSFARGKHQGNLLADVARKHPDYLMWMLEALDLPEDTSAMVNSALDGN